MPSVRAQRPVGETSDVAVDSAIAATTSVASEWRQLSNRREPSSSARSARRRSACADAITPSTLGVPAANFHGSAPYSTWSGVTLPSATMSPPYRKGNDRSSSASRA